MKAFSRFTSGHPGFCLWLVVSMVTTTPVLSDWLENRYQVSAQDLVAPLILSLITATLVTIVYRRLLKKERFAAFLATVGLSFLVGGRFQPRLDAFNGLIRALNPIPNLDEAEGMVFSVLFFLALTGLMYWLGLTISSWMKNRHWKTTDLMGGITIFIMVTFVLQFYATAHTLIIEWPQFFYRPAQLGGQLKVSAATTKPDIYYIVLDRYASQNVLQTQFGFDNQDFIGFLANSGFKVNSDNHQSYPYTTMSISSTLNANYQTDIVRKFGQASQQGLSPYHDAIRYSSVIQQLKTIGYSYYHLGSWYEASNKAPLADHYYQPEGQLTVVGHTFTLNNFAKNELTQSLFWQTIQHGLSVSSLQLVGYSAQGEVDATRSKLAILNQLAANPNPGGRFIFAHMLIPHDPYYFNANGSLSLATGNDNNGQPIKQKYLNQVQFINSQMKSLITKINQRSNNQAIIIMQSDEGPYPFQLNDENFDGSSVETEVADGSMVNWSSQDLLMKYGNLAAYHIPKATVEDLNSGADNVNVFRLVLNTYFQDNLPYLPRCYYGYVNGRSQPFVYTDINKQLTGADNLLCPKDSNFK